MAATIPHTTIATNAILLIDIFTPNTSYFSLKRVTDQNVCKDRKFMPHSLWHLATGTVAPTEASVRQAIGVDCVVGSISPN